MKNNTFYIPIGSSCKPTWYLQKIGFRKIAFPFDWTVTPIESALKIINNNFVGFFNKENLIFLPPCKRLLFKDDENNPELTDDIITPVYDKKFHILYVHDFSKKGKMEYELVKNKYMRRVERLRKLLEDINNKLFFIYDNDEPNDWQKSQYNQVNFKFKKLSEDDIKNLYFNRENIKFVSLEDLKKELNK